MGNTFSTMQIRNRQRMKPDAFAKALCACFEKKGLIPASEEEAQFSYRLVFSDKSDWVALVAMEYETSPQQFHSDAEAIAKALKTYSMAISVWDSDMLELRLFGSTAKQKDYVVVGRQEDGIPAPKGEGELWKPLLASGATWEQLLTAFNAGNAFVEDSLYEIAPLLGIEPKIVMTDHDAIRSDEPNVIDLHFKKAADSKEKTLSLNAAFKQIYGEALKPLGFVKIKSKYPYFVRLVGDEILHIVTYTSESHAWTFTKKDGAVLHDYAFQVYAGIATVYRQNIDFTSSPKSNAAWLSNTAEFYYYSNPLEDCDHDFRQSIIYFPYHKNNVSTVSAVTHSLTMTQKYILPCLDEVKSLDMCVNFHDKYRIRTVDYYGHENFGNQHRDFSNEWLLKIKVLSCNEYIEKIRGSIERHLLETEYGMKIGRCGFSQDEYIKECEECRKRMPGIISRAKEMYGDSEWHEKALIELQRRKIANLEALKAYGLEIKNNNGEVDKK